MSDTTAETCAQLDARDPTIERGLRDPRLWSNLRGALTGESTAERVAAHGRLSCAEGQSIGDAWREGFTRAGTESAAICVPLVALCAAAVALPIAIRRRRGKGPAAS